MNITNLVSTLALAVLLSACAGTPQFQSPQPRTPGVTGYTLARSAQLDQTSHTLRHLDDDKNILYFQNYGGGGVAVGVLLGPVGALANGAMIESRTKADVHLLHGKVAVNPRQLFQEVAQREGVDLARGPAKPQITPYLYVSKTADEKLLLASALLVEQGEGSTKWTGKYMYQLSSSYRVSDLAGLPQRATEDLNRQVADGYSKLLNHLNTESQDRLQHEKPIIFRSGFLSPRFDNDMVGALISDRGDLVWVRTAGGVYAVRKYDLSYELDD